ncbi:MAG: magnesium chelatase subunit [Solirubrobacteraceae bacterium]
MNQPRGEDGHHVGRLLACAALEPALRSVLCFDHDADQLTGVAATLASALHAVGEGDVQQFVLSSGADEESLWMRLSLRGDRDGLQLRLVPGPLGPQENESAIVLVVVHDLARLSLPAARACVMLVGADVAHLERHGQQRRWRPRTCWVAGCRSADVGRISPHLLDRFAIRLARSSLDIEADARAALEAAATGVQPPRATPEDPFDAVDVQRARRLRPRRRRAAIHRVFDLLGDSGHGLRRHLTLARIAVAEARLQGAAYVGAEHVDRAAALLMAPATRVTEARPPMDPAPSQPELPSAKHEERHMTAGAQPDAPSGAGGQPAIRDEPVLVADAATRLEVAALTDVQRGAYPEDKAPVEREKEALRLPARPQQVTSTPRGAPVGVQPARDLRDIAVFATVIEALRLWPARRAAQPQGEGAPSIWPTDLRSYRRAPPLDAMLTVVIDYTCQKNWDSTPALVPFLRWAYVERASVCIVKIGAQDAASELRAERVLLRSILDARLTKELDAAAGRATPLAHGLELALHALRHGLHHGSRGVLEAWLVLITDGRGNVPLAASLSGEAPEAVGRQGLRDALGVAERIAALDRVRCVVVSPERQHRADFSRDLGRALSASIVSDGATGAGELADAR